MDTIKQPSGEFPFPNEETIRRNPAPTPNDPPWGIWAALGVWALSILFILLIPNLFVLPYIMSQGIEFSDAAKLREFMVTDRMAVILQLAPIILAHVLTLLAAWFVVTRYRTYSFRQMLGWKMNGFKIWHAVLIFVGFYAVAVALTTIFGEVENDFEKLVKTSRTAVYLVAFFATFTAPLVEEVVYRGLLYSAFFKKFGMTAAVILVTLIFTGVHVPQYSMDAIPDLATVITLLLLSLTLTLIRAWTGQLLPSIVLHTVINGIQAILLIAAPYLPTDTTPISPPTGLISWLLK